MQNEEEGVEEEEEVEVVVVLVVRKVGQQGCDLNQVSLL